MASVLPSAHLESSLRSDGLLPPSELINEVCPVLMQIEALILQGSARLDRVTCSFVRVPKGSFDDVRIINAKKQSHVITLL